MVPVQFFFLKKKKEFHKQHFGSGTRPKIFDKFYILRRVCLGPEEQQGPQMQEVLPQHSLESEWQLSRDGGGRRHRHTLQIHTNTQRYVHRYMQRRIHRHTRTHTCADTGHAHTGTHTQTHADIQINAQIHRHTFTDRHLRTLTHRRSHTNMCIQKHKHTCVGRRHTYTPRHKKAHTCPHTYGHTPPSSLLD